MALVTGALFELSRMIFLSAAALTLSLAFADRALFLPVRAPSSAARYDLRAVSESGGKRAPSLQTGGAVAGAVACACRAVRGVVR